MSIVHFHSVRWRYCGDIDIEKNIINEVISILQTIIFFLQTSTDEISFITSVLSCRYLSCISFIPYDGATKAL